LTRVVIWYAWLVQNWLENWLGMLFSSKLTISYNGHQSEKYFSFNDACLIMRIVWLLISHKEFKYIIWNHIKWELFNSKDKTDFLLSFHFVNNNIVMNTEYIQWKLLSWWWRLILHCILCILFLSSHRSLFLKSTFVLFLW
jgi:hypothetical protein